MTSIESIDNQRPLRIAIQLTKRDQHSRRVSNELRIVRILPAIQMYPP